MGIGPLTRWKGDEGPSLARRLRWAGGVTVVAAALTGWLAGKVSVGSVLGYLMAYWIIASIATDFVQWLAPARARGSSLWAAVSQLGRAQAGMMLAHLGVAAFILGVTVVKTHETERDVKMLPGDTTEIDGYVFKLTSLQPVEGPNYSAMQGQITVTRGDTVVTQLTPEKRIYRIQQNPMTEAAIDSNLARDLYVSLGEALPDGAWTLRVQHKPMILWIWLGCLIMALGGGLAASDRRYRNAKRSETRSEARSVSSNAAAAALGGGAA
jgi:cytochrome c-type biogenesis protein CcmF